MGLIAGALSFPVTIFAFWDTVCERAPGWDKYMLESMYIEWAKTKDAARHEDARFLRWVTSYTKGKAAP